MVSNVRVRQGGPRRIFSNTFIFKFLGQDDQELMADRSDTRRTRFKSTNQITRLEMVPLLHLVSDSEARTWIRQDLILIHGNDDDDDDGRKKKKTTTTIDKKKPRDPLFCSKFVNFVSVPTGPTNCRDLLPLHWKSFFFFFLWVESWRLDLDPALNSLR